MSAVDITDSTVLTPDAEPLHDSSRRAQKPAAPDGSAVVPTRLLLALATLTAVSPFATDLYLAGLPQLALDLGTTTAGAQLTLTAFLIGVAVGQLALGPLSDRIGRRLPLVAGAAVAAVASIVTVLAPTLPMLVGARFVQGAAGAAGMVIGRAIIADIASGAKAARAMGLLMTITGVAPIVAPVLGGLLAAPLGWRGLLGIVVVLTVVALVVALFVPETLTLRRRAVIAASRTREGSPLRDLVSGTFIGNAMIASFSFAAIMAYVSVSPFLYQNSLGLSQAEFGLAFAGNSIALVGATYVSSRLVGRTGPRTMVTVGLGIVILAMATMVLAALTGAPTLVVALSLPVMLLGFGLSQGNVAATAITSVPRASGTASALLGFVQFALGGLASAAAGLAEGDPARSLAQVLAVSALMIVVGYVVSRPRPMSAEALAAFDRVSRPERVRQTA